MKKKQKILAAVLALAIMFSGGFNSTTSYADYDRDSPYVYMPDNNFRTSAYWSILSELQNNNTTGQAEIDEFNTLYNTYGLFTKEMAKTKILHFGGEMSPTSLEGLQDFTNIENFTIGFGDVVDFRPISESSSLLSELFIRNNSSIANLDVFKNISTLQTLYLELYGNNVTPACIDISAISNFVKLNYIKIYTTGVLQSITLSDDYRNYELYDPVILSSQFDGAAITYSSTDSCFTNSNNILKWNDIPYGTDNLQLSWTIKDGYSSYSGDATIPINWR